MSANSLPSRCALGNGRPQFFPLLTAALAVIASTACSQVVLETGRTNWLAASPEFMQKGRFEATLTSGALFSPFVATKNRPVLNYKVSEFQFGYMLTDPQGTSWRRGNFELVGEAFGDYVLEGQGTYIAGMTVWLRYNFVPEQCLVVPFFQAGTGLTATDVDHTLLGETFNFNLNLGLGARIFVASNLSINLEYRYQHISNANLARKNLGINAHGPVLGVSLFF